MKSLTISLGLLVTLTLVSTASATEKTKSSTRLGVKGQPMILFNKNLPKPKPPEPSSSYERKLAMGEENQESDLEHFRKLKRRMGVDLGVMLPFGDFNREFETGQAIGIHFTWKAIDPVDFTIAMLRSSASNKTNPGSGKLSVTAITVGGQATFPKGRFSPFVKLNGGFYFNDVSFGSGGAAIEAGYDSMLTTVGVSLGLGFDFIVGREISLGLDAVYHYPVPKKLQITGGSFNLGSPFAVVNFRVNF